MYAVESMFRANKTSMFLFASKVSSALRIKTYVHIHTHIVTLISTIGYREMAFFFSLELQLAHSDVYGVS